MPLEFSVAPTLSGQAGFVHLCAAPPTPCWAMGLPSPSPRWSLAPNSDPLHHQSSLSPRPPDSPCAKFKAWDQAAETELKRKKKKLVLHLSCPGSVPCLVLNNLQHLWLKPPAKPLLPSKCAEKPAGLVPFPQGPDKGLSVNCM